VLEPPKDARERAFLQKMRQEIRTGASYTTEERLRALLSFEMDWQRCWWVRPAASCGWQSLLTLRPCSPTKIRGVATDGTHAAAFVTRPGSAQAHLLVFGLTDNSRQRIGLMLDGKWRDEGICTLRITGKVLALATDLGRGRIDVFVRHAGQREYTFQGRIFLTVQINAATAGDFCLNLALKGPLLAVSVGTLVCIWDLWRGNCSGYWEAEPAGDGLFFFSSLLWEDDASRLTAVDIYHNIHTWKISSDTDDGVSGDGSNADFADFDLSMDIDSLNDCQDPNDWLGWCWAIDFLLKKRSVISWRKLRKRLVRLYKIVHGHRVVLPSNAHIGRCGLARIPIEYLSKNDQYVRK